ncbi:MAG: hypothetical protein CR997_08030 [Acidobacteria bacterium]|nr:MAG: hypothetical protein CR997_08030 [Acidobacteriota bacterium]
MSDQLFSVGDFLYILLKRKGILFSAWILLFALFMVYGFVAKKTYELEGTLSIGKFNEELLEEGEFVAQKLQDYSFIKQAMDEAGVKLDVSVSKLQKLIKTEVVNEIKKNKDVGLVRLRIRYKDPQKIVAIFKALTRKIIHEHELLLAEAKTILDKEEKEIRDLINKTIEAQELDVKISKDTILNTAGKTVPSLLLAEHNLSSNRNLQSTMITSLYKVVMSREAITKSVPTQLSAEPQVPDAHIRPVWMVVIAIGIMAASVFACATVMFFHILEEDVKPRFTKG